jgi:hypothetical protein
LEFDNPLDRMEISVLHTWKTDDSSIRQKLSQKEQIVLHVSDYLFDNPGERAASIRRESKPPRLDGCIL